MNPQYIKCPACGNTGEEPFFVDIECLAEWTLDGGGEVDYVEFTEDGYARCTDCGWQGKTSSLRNHSARLAEIRNDIVEYLTAVTCYGSSVAVRLQYLDNGDWEIHAGDASYDLCHQGYWGSGILDVNDSVKMTGELVDDMIEQVKEHLAQ